MQRVRVCGADEIADGEMMKAEADGRAIAVYRVDGAFFATSDVCSHGQSSLTEEGELDGFTIECGWHFGRFDIRTGAVLASPCTHAIAAYATLVEDGDVFVLIGTEA